MLKGLYDLDCTTWSPQGKLFQVEYAIEAIKVSFILLSSAHLLSVSKSPKESSLQFKEDSTPLSLYPKALKKYSKSIHTSAVPLQVSSLMPEPSLNTEELKL